MSLIRPAVRWPTQSLIVAGGPVRVGRQRLRGGREALPGGRQEGGREGDAVAQPERVGDLRRRLGARLDLGEQVGPGLIGGGRRHALEAERAAHLVGRAPLGAVQHERQGGLDRQRRDDDVAAALSARLAGQQVEAKPIERTGQQARVGDVGGVAARGSQGDGGRGRCGVPRERDHDGRRRPDHGHGDDDDDDAAHAASLAGRAPRVLPARDPRTVSCGAFRRRDVVCLRKVRGRGPAERRWSRRRPGLAAAIHVLWTPRLGSLE